MLSESDVVTEQTQWKKVKGLFERDVRYKVVEGSVQREEWFNEHVKLLASKVRVLGEEEDFSINRALLCTFKNTHTHVHIHTHPSQPLHVTYTLTRDHTHSRTLPPTHSQWTQTKNARSGSRQASRNVREK